MKQLNSRTWELMLRSKIAEMMLAVALLFSVTAARAQTFTTLHSFDLTDGANPYAELVQATDGKLYGTTIKGGADVYGTVFKITSSGTLTTLHSFDSTHGADAYAGLVQATDGNFYGTTFVGGAVNRGTVFKITPRGTLTTLHSFGLTGGQEPYAGLVQATDGNFYGTTHFGGSNACSLGCGTVFKITPSGTLTTLHSFDGTDGAYPESSLIQASNGNFYGTTSAGGTVNRGTVFKITLSGTLTKLHNFVGDPTDGNVPDARLVQATNGNFYGTTVSGGANNDGTVFKMTPSGTLTTLHSFDATEGQELVAGLVQASDGNFYGTTRLGGTHNFGTVFKIIPSGTVTTLHSLDATDGEYPYAGLVQKTNGTFYGTTIRGGAHSNGTVFSLSVGLGPFVETQSTSGKVGAAVKILGDNLTGATSVTFNGTAAVFKVILSSEIMTTVPAGATTGKVKVVTPRGTLFSNAPFRVLP